MNDSGYFVRKQHHNGIDFTMFQLKKPSRGEVATTDAKYHLDGCPSVTIADGQYKYGDEAIMQIFAKKGSIITKQRVNENYDRSQIFCNKKIFLEIVKEIYDKHLDPQRD